MKKQEFLGISKRAYELLDGQEGFDVDFKRVVSGLTSEDLVAFANSNQGGAILLGVDEIKNTDGRQKGVIVGCPVGDEEKRKITDRAANSMPPIELEIYFENLNIKPFIRIEIPSGKNKPYCTGGGTYKIRGDGVNQVLTPHQLFTIFEEKEGEAFIKRFTSATKGLVDQMNVLINSTWTLDDIMQDTLNSARSSEGMTEEAMSHAEAAVEGVGALEQILSENISWELEEVQAKLDTILVHLNIEDPSVKKTRIGVEEFVVKQFKDGKSEKEIIGQLTEIFSHNRFSYNISLIDFLKWGKEKYSQLRNIKKGKNQGVNEI